MKGYTIALKVHQTQRMKNLLDFRDFLNLGLFFKKLRTIAQLLGFYLRQAVICSLTLFENSYGQKYIFVEDLQR